MKNILYICELPAYHISNELTVFKDDGFNVIVLNVFKTNFKKIENYEENVILYNLHNNLKNYPSIKLIEILYKHSIDYDLIEKIILKHKINILYSSWSSMVILDTFFIKKRFPNLKWIHRYLMYPASLNKLKINIENFIMKKYTKYIDHIIFHTDEMKDYFVENINNHIEHYTVQFEKFNNSYFLDDKEYFNIQNNKFSLIFLGSIIPNTENDILKELESLPIEIDIYINIRDEFKYLIKNKNIKFFDRKKIGKELTQYIQNFDGILALYNQKSIDKERINLVIPNRITLGIPALKRFFIPNNQLTSSRKLLKSFDLLCEYSDNSTLLDQLENNRKKSIKSKQTLKKELMLNSFFIEIFNKVMK